ncbi:AraC family transcriptional regulator [Deinococcus cavernae]|uniref:AraC family transcriptional regulator n=1 Tax=Deinococcus cavernae TaxID=2320857 RepID=UPI0011C22F7C|nr:AraC family transcriptional regulator [Deinococcus cavernae]
MSRAVTSSELVFTRQGGVVQVALVGPVTEAAPAPVPLEAEFLGVPFAPGTLLSSLLLGQALNGGLTLPLASSRAFWLNGSAIPIPREDELDAFVACLLARGELPHSAVVPHVLLGLPVEDQSLRTVQRQFQHATGLSYRRFEQIWRASEAARLLQAGNAIADVVVLCRYNDQPHLTCALRR